MSNVNLKSRAGLALCIATSLHFVAVGVQLDAYADDQCELIEIAKAYKIEIVTDDPRFPVRTTYGTIDGRNAERKSLESYVGLFVQEFRLYPLDLVKRSRLTRVVLCQELSFAGLRRNAIPDFSHETLYLEVSRGAYSKPYLRKVIHHEFFHMIDYRDDGSLYQDERWRVLNPPEFKYGNGGRNAQGVQTTSVLTDEFPGFLNHYSTTAVEEDKAEIFANLLVEPAAVEHRAKQDHVLTAKVVRMKDLLSNYSPEINDEFWAKVRKLKRANE